MKKDIKSLPFEEIEQTYDDYKETEKAASKIAVATFVERYLIKDQWVWLGEQILAYIASEIRFPTTAEGKVVITDILDQIGESRRLSGLWRMLVTVPRGNLMDKQTAQAHVRMCGLVPPFLAAAKEYHGISYKAWDAPALEYIVEEQLYKAMREAKPRPECDLLAIRDKGLKYVSKSGAIKSYNPETYYRLTGVEDTELAGFSALSKVMLTQIWCAHPSNRNKLMVLDSYDWDLMPEPLITTDIIIEPTKKWYEIH